jgi:hypothetical protein
MAALGVVHLVWVPLGLEILDRFLASYERCPGGIDHDLIIVFNGFRNKMELDPFFARLCNIKHHPLLIEPFQQDIASYSDAVKRYPYETLCFVNSYVRLQDAQWLAKLYEHLQRPGVGVAGNSGSWESRVPLLTRERERILKRPLHLRLLGHARLAFQLSHYEPFPNYHIRTNGFMIRRDLLLSLTGMAVRNKSEAWTFERTRFGMTSQILKLGLRPMVVGADGRGYEKEEWAQSNTFWQGDQGNLLLTDNRTDEYAQCAAHEKRELWLRAWHGQALPPIEIEEDRRNPRTKESVL